LDRGDYVIHSGFERCRIFAGFSEWVVIESETIVQNAPLVGHDFGSDTIEWQTGPLRTDRLSILNWALFCS